MNGTTTRARTGRATADQRRSARAGASYVDGANALQIGYAEDIKYDDQIGYAEEQALLAPPATRPSRRVRPRSTTVDAPVTPPLPIALPRAPFLLLMVTLVVVGVVGVLVLNTK